MYRPTYSIGTDSSIALELIHDYPLATIMSIYENQIETSLIPFIYDEGSRSLLGHMARANPHWKKFGEKQLVISFRGPDRYISPSIYENKLNVPTWNYAVVEVKGKAQILESLEDIELVLSRSVASFEASNDSNWKYDLPADFTSKLLKGIVGIKIQIENIEAKFKLSQNRQSEDYVAVSQFLEKSASHFDQEMLRWMQKTATNKV